MRKLEMDIKVGFFVTLGVALVMIAILVLGSAQNLMVRKNTYTVHFSSVEGLIPGAKVVLGGLQIGLVKSVDLDPQERSLRVALSVDRKSGEWIRADSRAEIATQGVLGDKFIAISPGALDQPVIPDGAIIPVRPSKDLNQFLNKGDQLMISLMSLAHGLDRMVKTFESGNRSDTFFQGMATTAKNLASVSEKMNRDLELRPTIKNINNILEKINNGSGTLGALVNDPGLYDDIKLLVGGANRNRVVRNLVRETIKKSDEAEAAEAKKNPKVPNK